MSGPSARTRLSLDGPSVGDAFGECFLRQIVSPLGVASGDIDTNCAVVGGIVAMSAKEHGVPAEWVRARGPLRATQWPDE